MGTKWTASVNIFGDEDGISYSVRIWRVGSQYHTFRRPQRAFSGTLKPVEHPNPHDWLREVLGGIRAQI